MSTSGSPTGASRSTAASWALGFPVLGFPVLGFPAATGTRRCCAGSGPPTRTSSASRCRTSASASRSTWTGCRSSARPSRCGTVNGTCTSAQRAVRRGYYPLMLRTPLRDSVFFVSCKGKQCGDNPLGIAEELRRRGDDREHLWAVTDWSVPVPEGGTGVLRGTEEYYEALARSKYIISNDDMQAPFRKRDDQVYLQTWHGTPLKKIGFDIANPQFISGTAYFDHLARDIAQWDLLLSPNPFST